MPRNPGIRLPRFGALPGSGAVEQPGPACRPSARPSLTQKAGLPRRTRAGRRVPGRSAWRWRRGSGCKLLNGWAPNPTRLLAYASQPPYPVCGFEPPPPSRPGVTKARARAGWCRSCPSLRPTISAAGRSGRGSRFSPSRRAGLGALPRTPSQRSSRSPCQRMGRPVPSMRTILPSSMSSMRRCGRRPERADRACGRAWRAPG